MFDILRKSLRTGIVTSDYPSTPVEMSAGARGRPEFDFAKWKDARPAAAICPTGAISVTDQNGTRTVRFDLGNCTFCGLCAEADSTVRITNVCELAARAKAELVTTANYQVAPDGSQSTLVNLQPSTFNLRPSRFNSANTASATSAVELRPPRSGVRTWPWEMTRATARSTSFAAFATPR